MAATSVGTSAVTLHEASGGQNILEGVVIHNNDTAGDAGAIIYFIIQKGDPASEAGGSTDEVSSTNGVPLAADEKIGVDLRAGERLRVISDTAATDVRWTVARGS